MAFESRLEALVVGPGKPGQVRVALGHGQHQFVADVPFELLQPSLRMLNSEFVAVVKDRDLVRIACRSPLAHDPRSNTGRPKIAIGIQLASLTSLTTNTTCISDYIGHIYSLLAKDAAEQAICDHLLWIELERMGLTGTPMKPTAPSGGKSAKPSATASVKSWLVSGKINQAPDA